MTKRKNHKADELTDEPRTGDPVYGMLGGCFLTVCVLPIGMLLSISVIFYPAIAEKASANWVETPCVIEVCQLDETVNRNPEGGSRVEYYLTLEYSYEFAGKTYRSHRVDFGLGESKQMSLENEEIVSDYPPGTQSSCLVDPNDPTDSVLFPNRRVHTSTRVFAWSLLIVGGFGPLVSAYCFWQMSTES